MEKNRITIDPKILVGKPVITGTRIPVVLIINLVANGYTFERILEAYPVLKREDVEAALDYSARRIEREDIHPIMEHV